MPIIDKSHIPSSANAVNELKIKLDANNAAKIFVFIVIYFLNLHTKLYILLQKKNILKFLLIVFINSLICKLKTAMNELNSVSHFKNFTVSSYECDQNLNLKTHCLFQWFSEIAWEHAKKLNFGFEELNSTDYYWVLLGMNVRIEKLPVWQQKIKLQTWPSGIEGLYFSREFMLFDESDNLLVAARSTWLIYNRQTNRPIIPTGKEFEYKTNNTKAVETNFSKLKAQSNFDKKFNVIANYTDIDLHKHVNNAVYIKWIENIMKDIFPNKISEIKIQYIKEVKIDDVIEISVKQEDNICFYEALVNADKVCFRAEVMVGC